VDPTPKRVQYRLTVTIAGQEEDALSMLESLNRALRAARLSPQFCAVAVTSGWEDLTDAR
jgi:hypothetical protein